MSQTDLNKSIEIITKTEELADKILANKQELTVMDKRRQENREALRLIEKSNEPKAWITIGSMLVKMKREQAIELLKKGEQSTPNKTQMFINLSSCRSATNRTANQPNIFRAEDSGEQASRCGVQVALLGHQSQATRTQGVRCTQGEFAHALVINFNKPVILASNKTDFNHMCLFCGALCASLPTLLVELFWRKKNTRLWQLWRGALFALTICCCAS